MEGSFIYVIIIILACFIALLSACFMKQKAFALWMGSCIVAINVCTMMLAGYISDVMLVDDTSVVVIIGVINLVLYVGVLFLFIKEKC